MKISFKTTFNVTLEKGNAIQSLQSDISIVRKEADKSGYIVIMNKDFYKRKMLESLTILQDTNVYKPITLKCSKQMFTKIRKLIKDADEITRHEISYLLEFD